MEDDRYEPNALCIHCGYAIDLLGEHRCAECGEPFDPYNWNTYRSPNRIIDEPFTLSPLARLVCAALLLLMGVLLLTSLRARIDIAYHVLAIAPLAAGFGFALNVLLRGRGLVQLGALLVLGTDIFFLVMVIMYFLREIL